MICSTHAVCGAATRTVIAPTPVGRTSEEEHEVVLTEERPVVAKETVPVERVRLGKESVTEQQQVTEDVAHEELTTDGDGRSTR
jgi:stress response protein YsnF